MNKIKVRAWNKEAETMAYSDYRNREEYQYIYDFLIDNEGKLICEWMDDYDDSCGFPVSRRGVLDNIMQDTELKDCVGGDIYAEDILLKTYINQMTEKEVLQYYRVENINGCYWARALGSRGDALLYFINDKVKVIGNIYENPELMEGQDK